MCPGPEIWGVPQRNRPWIVPPGHDIHWGSHSVLNNGPGGHKLQWFEGNFILHTLWGWTAWEAKEANPTM
eukprot:9563479-Karenia_brevis.AAC.1